MNAEVKVRRATRNDTRGIVEVVKTSFPQDFFFDGAFRQKIAEDMFVRAIEDPYEFVCVGELNEGIVGFVYYINKPPTNGTILLEMIGVREGFQGKGIGLRLLELSDEEAVRYFRDERGVQNLATIHLTTSGDNQAGQRLYLKNGYSHVGNIPGLVGEGNVELVMLKKVGDVKYKTGLWAKERSM